MSQIILQIILIVVLLFITYYTGSYLEKRHFKNIRKRETALIKKPVISFGAKNLSTNKKIKKVELVTGEVVISGDFFKNFVASFKKIIGGSLTPFESVMDRARREAILRMREKAKNAGIIVNVRIESVMVNDLYYSQSIPQCAVIAYGTAITYEPEK